MDRPVSTMNSDIAGDVLSNIVIVVERIFKYLNSRQLNNCARVCKSWQAQALRERECRPVMKWNCFISRGLDDGDLDEDWWSSVISFLKESPIQPKFLLIFCTETLWRRLLEQPCPGKKRRRTKKEATTVFTPYIPNSCTYHIIVTDGLVGTNTNMKTTELEEYDSAISLLMFRESACVEFVPFSLTHAECLSLTKYWSEGSNDDAPLCMRELMQKEIKMINLYCPMSGIDQEIGYSLCRMFQWPLIAGGYVNERLLKDSVGNFHSSERNCIVSGVAVCGHGVKVASVLIRSDASTEQEVDSIMQVLAKQDFPLLNSFGLMYACVGRGVHVYKRHNVESSIFRKYFPKTPLFGFFGNGEIGCSHLPHDLPFMGSERLSRTGKTSKHMDAHSESDDAEMHNLKASNSQQQNEIKETHKNQDAYKMKHPPKLLHAYTTIMCLVALP